MFESDEERRKFENLCDTVQEIKSKVDSIDVLLIGKDDDPEPSGLRYQVSENTKHRKNTNRFLWLLATTTTGLVITELLKMI